MEIKEAIENVGRGLAAIAAAGLLVVAFISAVNAFCPEEDFYNFHVAECEAAHSRNMTFLLCSGFEVEPGEANDFENPCAINPKEDCRTEVPHGSLLGTRKCIWEG